ncbi:MAG: hypothetical protein U0N90_09310 [Blautia sp.]
MKTLNQKLKDNIETLLEKIYIVVLILWISYFFLNTTTFRVQWPEFYYTSIRIAFVAIIFMRACYSKTYSYIELGIIGILFVCFSFAVYRNGYTELKDALLVIFGAKDISFKKLLKIYSGTIGILLLLTIILALRGYIDNLIYYQDGRRPRIAFGIGYPTDFSAYIFYILLAYFYIRGKRIKYLEIVSGIVAAIAVYWFCDARLNTICILLLSAIFLYNRIIQKICEKNNKLYIMNRLWSHCLTLSATIASIFMILLTLFYSTDNHAIQLINNLLNNRLFYGNRGIKIYGLSFWGQYIPQQGAGGSTESITHYFFLDVSYVSILLRYGIVILGLVLLIWLIIGIKAQKGRNWELLWAIALVAIQCAVEHHMLEVVYCPFLWALFANTNEQEKIEV